MNTRGLVFVLSCVNLSWSIVSRSCFVMDIEAKTKASSKGTHQSNWELYTMYRLIGAQEETSAANAEIGGLC